MLFDEWIGRTGECENEIPLMTSENQYKYRPISDRENVIVHATETSSTLNFIGKVCHKYLKYIGLSHLMTYLDIFDFYRQFGSVPLHRLVPM